MPARSFARVSADGKNRKPPAWSNLTGSNRRYRKGWTVLTYPAARRSGAIFARSCTANTRTALVADELYRQGPRPPRPERPLAVYRPRQRDYLRAPEQNSTATYADLF